MPRHAESTLAAIKQAVDIVALVGEYLPLHRSGNRYKALCPFHDDHNPSLEVNPDRQSYKCWSCGAGGDVFDFVQSFERVEFSEALRMLADRAGVILDPVDSSRGVGGGGSASKTELLEVLAWAQEQYRLALGESEQARSYMAGRRISEESAARFCIGFAPEQRDWIVHRAQRDGFTGELLEAAGLVSRQGDAQVLRDRFRGRLIFPIRDLRGRTVAFGGRILPEIERQWAGQEIRVAKYLNSPETAVFQKRRHLYAADLARPAARESGWVAVVEGYTDVIAAHQAGITQVVGTLGTALGDDHVIALRRLADLVVLVFDGDEAGQKAADRSLELFLGHALDMRVLALPAGQDPCDVIHAEGSSAFHKRLAEAFDPLEFAIERAMSSHDVRSAEGTRQAAEAVLNTLARVPRGVRSGGLEMKLAKALDTLGRRLHLPVEQLNRELRRLRRGRHVRLPAGDEPGSQASGTETQVIRPVDLDPLDREIMHLVLSHPELIGSLRGKVPCEQLSEPCLQALLQAAYELDREGEVATFERLSLRLDDSSLRSLAAALLLPIESSPLSDGTDPAPVGDRLAAALHRLAEREWMQRVRDLEAAKAEVDPQQNPDAFRALQREYLRVLIQRPALPRK